MIDQIVEKLLLFKEDDWIIYIQKLSHGLNPNPSLLVISRDLIEQLYWLYNKLNAESVEARFLFTKCLLRFLRNLEPQKINSALIYTIIQFINEFRPIEHRKYLELMIRDESFSNLSFASENLHLLLIKAYTYTEDPENLFLEEYLKNNRFRSQPYFLYVIMNYYIHAGQNTKALDSFSVYFADGGANLNKEFCIEAYGVLTDFIPSYVDLDDFIEYIIENNIKFDFGNPYLSNYLNKFINNLKFKSDIGLVLFAEDVLKHQINNYLNKYQSIGELAENRRISKLIIKHVNKFLPQFSDEENLGFSGFSQSSSDDQSLSLENVSLQDLADISIKDVQEMFDYVN